MSTKKIKFLQKNFEFHNLTDAAYDMCDNLMDETLDKLNIHICHMNHATYDIKKHSHEKNFLQNYDFLFVWNVDLIINIKNFLFFINSVENRIFLQVKNLTNKTFKY